MASKPVRHVRARFGGHDVIFRLPSGGQLALVEMIAGAAAFDMARRFAAGQWSTRELQAVLAMSVEATAITGRIDPLQHVVTTLRAGPAATYAVLASRVLQAGLFGIANDEATFDEGAVL